MEKGNIRLARCNPDIDVDAHIDFKLNGWPASIVLITFCLSGVMIYGIKVWSDARIK